MMFESILAPLHVLLVGGRNGWVLRRPPWLANWSWSASAPLLYPGRRTAGLCGSWPRRACQGSVGSPPSHLSSHGRITASPFPVL